MEELPPITLDDNIEMTPLETSVLLTGGAVTSVNGKTGAVVLEASDVGAASTDALRLEANARASSDNALQSRITAETNARQNADASLQTAIENEATTRRNTDTALQSAINAETTARTNADNTLQGNINTETSARQSADTAINSSIATINGKIPNQASTTNQLADKAFVNSSVQTATANFRGNWDTYADIPTSASSYPADYAGSTTPTTNDYLVVQDASDTPVSAGEEALTGTWRFKYSGTWATSGKSGWQPEYQVNETPLTAAQLAALNSGITDTLVGQISTNQGDISNLQTAVAGKQDALTAGANITIDSATDTISATDTTYSNFTGTDGTSSGVAGLVPAPSTTDVGSFLKADGTWADVPSGTLYSAVGQNTDGSMTQKAVTDLIYAGNATNRNASVRIGNVPLTQSIGTNSIVVGSYNGNGVTNSYQTCLGFGVRTGNFSNYSVSIGYSAGSNGSSQQEKVAIGFSAQPNGIGSVALGANTTADSGTNYSVALGYYAKVTRVGEVNIGSANNNYGYNSTNYRVLGGVHDGVNDHDAANVGQLNTAVAIKVEVTLSTTDIGEGATLAANTLYGVYE